MRICHTHFRRFYEETAVGTGLAVNPVRGTPLCGTPNSIMRNNRVRKRRISNGVNINSSLLPDQVEDKLGRGNF